MKVSCSLRGGRRVFESGFVASQIVIQKLAEVNETRRRKIAPARPSATVLRNILHPHRELTEMRLVMSGKRSTEKPRIMRDHRSLSRDQNAVALARRKMMPSFASARPGSYPEQRNK